MYVYVFGQMVGMTAIYTVNGFSNQPDHQFQVPVDADSERQQVVVKIVPATHMGDLA